MKILVVCQHYYPEPFRITDICEELVKRGHTVSVITGLPNYPVGEIYDGYKHGKNRNQCINGVNIHRCYTIGRKGGVIKRILNYYSFAYFSSVYARRLKEEFDIVFVNQLSPVMMACAGIKYKLKHKKKMLIYCLDLWPESLIAGGISRGSAIYKLFNRISKKIYRRADGILITSKLFRKYFNEHFEIEDENITYLPQYAEALFNATSCYKKPNGNIDLMFAGNIGVAQSITTILKAAKLTQDIPNLYWHIVGDGSEAEACKKLCKELGLQRVTFYGKRPLEEMPYFYSMADAMIVSLIKDPVLSLTLPGKMQTYMAAGKPIIGSIDGEAAEVIDSSGCGYCSAAEDERALAENVRKFCNQYSLCDAKNFGDNSLEYYNKNFTKEAFFKTLENLMSQYSK